MNQKGYQPQGNIGYGTPGGSPQGYSPAPVNGFQGYTNPGYQMPQATGGMAQGYPGYSAAQDAGGMNPVGYPQTAAAPQGGFRGYSPGQTGSMNSVGYPQTQGTSPTGYPPPGGTMAQSGYPGYAQAGAPQGYSYPGYPAGQLAGTYTAPGTIPPQPGIPTGSFIPQTPYSRGYTSPNYQPPGYASQGYNAFQQMGKSAQPEPQPTDYSRIMPLNGGGYVPPKVPIRKKPTDMSDLILIGMGIVMIVLFVLAVFVIRNTGMKILTILVGIGTAGLLWLRPLTAENKRLCYSIVAMALCAATAVSFISPGKGGNKDNIAKEADTKIITSQDGAEQTANTGLMVNTAAPTTEANTPEPDESIMLQRLVAFFNYWNGNRQDEMLALCAPSWLSKQENPRSALFQLLSNRTPKDCTPESVSGTAADTSRRVTLTSTMDRNNMKKPELFRLTVLMLRENNEWYIDPQSLQTYEIEETPDPNITEAPSPTPTMAVYPTTVLYYNPSGGEYYHADPNCKTTHAKFLPLQGHFTYAELLSDSKYANLKPCNVCGAPLREQ